MYGTAVTFSQTMRSLRADRHRTSFATILLIALVLGSWFIWLVRARVSVYAVSEAARVEISSPSVAIQSVYAGRISRAELSLGRRVKKGDVLVELDANLQRLQLKEEESQGSSIQAEINALQNQMTVQRTTSRKEERAAQIALDEARAKLQEGSAAAAFAAAQVERFATLDREGLLAHGDLARARSDQEQAKANLDGLRLEIGRQQRELLIQKGESESRIQDLGRQIDQLMGSGTRLVAAVNRMRSEVDLRQIVAPVDGVVGEVANLPLGSVISAGQRLGAIVPNGDLRVVAQFDPAKSIGRIRRGQHARIRLQGFALGPAIMRPSHTPTTKVNPIPNCAASRLITTVSTSCLCSVLRVR